MNILYKCPFCGEENELVVTLPKAAVLGGPPEACSPPENGEAEPPDCAKCGAMINQQKAQELAEDKAKWLNEYNAEEEGD